MENKTFDAIPKTRICTQSVKIAQGKDKRVDSVVINFANKRNSSMRIKTRKSIKQQISNPQPHHSITKVQYQMPTQEINDLSGEIAQDCNKKIEKSRNVSRDIRKSDNRIQKLNLRKVKSKNLHCENKNTSIPAKYNSSVASDEMDDGRLQEELDTLNCSECRLLKEKIQKLEKQLKEEKCLSKKLDNKVKLNESKSNEVESKTQSLTRLLNDDEQFEILKNNEHEARMETADVRHRLELEREKNESFQGEIECLNSKYLGLVNDNNKLYSLLKPREKESKDISMKFQILKQRHKDEKENLSKRLKNAEEDSKSNIILKEKYQLLMQKQDWSDNRIQELLFDIQNKNYINAELPQNTEDSVFRNESHARDVIEIHSDEDENTIQIE